MRGACAYHVPPRGVRGFVVPYKVRVRAPRNETLSRPDEAVAALGDCLRNFDIKTGRVRMSLARDHRHHHSGYLQQQLLLVLLVLVHVAAAGVLLL